MSVTVGGTTYSSAEIRQWAKGAGIPVEPRGRIPGWVNTRFENHINSQLPAKPVPRKVVGAKVAIKENKLVNTPKCPVHSVEMKMNGELGMWTCREKGCKLRAWPKEGSTKPLIGTGKITMVRETEPKGPGRFYLRSDNGVLMDITSVATDIRMESERGYGMTVTVEMVLHME